MRTIRPSSRRDRRASVRADRRRVCRAPLAPEGEARDADVGAFGCGAVRRAHRRASLRQVRPVGSVERQVAPRNAARATRRRSARAMRPRPPRLVRRWNRARARSRARVDARAAAGGPRSPRDGLPRQGDPREARQLQIDARSRRARRRRRPVRLRLDHALRSEDVRHSRTRRDPRTTHDLRACGDDRAQDPMRSPSAPA